MKPIEDAPSTRPIAAATRRGLSASLAGVALAPIGTWSDGVGYSPLVHPLPSPANRP